MDEKEQKEGYEQIRRKLQSGLEGDEAQVIRAPFLLVEGLLSMGPTPSSFYLLVEMGLPLHF